MPSPTSTANSTASPPSTEDIQGNLKKKKKKKIFEILFNFRIK